MQEFTNSVTKRIPFRISPLSSPRWEKFGTHQSEVRLNDLTGFDTPFVRSSEDWSLGREAESWRGLELWPEADSGRPTDELRDAMETQSAQGSCACSMRRLDLAKGAVVMQCRRDRLKVPPTVPPERLGPCKRNEVAAMRPHAEKESGLDKPINASRIGTIYGHLCGRISFVLSFGYRG